MKKIVSLLLSLSMLCGFSAQVFAETDNMNKVLNSVKSRITISSDYDAFLSNSYIDENGTEYTFSWENDDKSINVTANESGIISGYRYADCNQKQPIKKVSQGALYKAACSYVKKLNPDIYDNLKITGITKSATDDSCYFDIQRYENNIPVEGNRGYVAVSSDGKTLKDFFLTYTTGIEFERVNKIVSRNAARRAYIDKIGFKLCYGCNYDGNKIVAVPMYTLNNEPMKYISAASGNMIKLNDVSYGYDAASEEKQEAELYPKAADEYSETNELKGVTGILSKEQAETAARSNKIINIPENYTLKSVYGFKDDENKYFYTLLFVGAKNSDYVEVMMDAESGKIANFSRAQNKGKNVITNEKAKEIAKNALSYLAPEHVNDYILNASATNGVFSFIRSVNGVEFSANQINIYVDMTNGNIVWYDYSYSDINFPSLKRVISSDKISKAFFENADFMPVYVLNCSKPGMTRYDRATLVYEFSDFDVTEFDAFTGKAMWN